jgi:hypothetical protein
MTPQRHLTSALVQLTFSVPSPAIELPAENTQVDGGNCGCIESPTVLSSNNLQTAQEILFIISKDFLSSKLWYVTFHSIY